MQVPADDRPDLGRIGSWIPVSGVVTELEIRRIKELAVVRVRDGEQQPDLAAVYRRSAVRREAVQRQVKARLEPIGHTIRPFGDAIEIPVVHKAARERWGLQALGREVVMPGEIEYARFGNCAIVHLDLVVLRECRRREGGDRYR